MAATVLLLTPAVREAVLDARAIEKRVQTEGAAWAPALQKARDKVTGLAVGRDCRKPKEN